MAIEQTQQIISESPQIEAYKLGLLKRAQEQSETPYQLPAYQVAGMSPQQQTAEQLAQAGIGAYRPYLDAAGQGIAQGQNLAQTGARGVAGINASTDFAAAQRALQTGVGQAGQVGAYAQAAGAGMPTVAQGTQAVGQAVGQIPQYMQANLGPSQQMLGQAAQQTQAVQPQFGQAQGAIERGMGTGQAAMYSGMGGLQAGTGQFGPDMTQQFMNPYQQQVIDEALRQINRQGDIARQGAAAQAVGAGAFGGTREGVQRAEMERALAEQRNATILTGLQQGYGQSQQTAQQSFEAQQQRQQQAGQGIGALGAQMGALGVQGGQALGGLESQQAQIGLAGAQQLAGIGQQIGAQQLQQSQLGQAGVQNLGALGAQQAQLGLLPAQIASQQGALAGQSGQLYGQLGQGIGALAGQEAGIGLEQASTLGQLGQTIGTLGVQQAALGQAQQQMGLSDISTMSTLGGIRQANEQAALDAARATTLQETMAPYQQLGFLSDIYKGAPTSQMSMTAASAPSPSPATQAIGLGISGLSAASGASRAGIF
jgi:hypothetical protein